MGTKDTVQLIRSLEYLNLATRKWAEDRESLLEAHTLARSALKKRNKEGEE